MEPWLAVTLLIVGCFGVLGFFLGKKNAVSNILGMAGKPVGVKADMAAMIIGGIFVFVGFSAGGVGVITGFIGGFTDGGSTASIFTSEKDVAKTDYIGDLRLTIHDGYSNTTTTEDYVDDDDVTMRVYSADASIADGEEYLFNITVERTDASYGGTILIKCSAPDKEVSGVTADSLVEKTGGEIDLDINDGGSHTSNTVVEKLIAIAAGTASTEVEIAFDQEETYHDGLTDMDDTFEVTCTVSDQVDSEESVLWVMKANS